MKKDFYVVAIGASAGGIEALCGFFKEIPIDINLCFIVIPHLKAGYHSRLDEILRKYVDLPVIRVTKNMRIFPKNVYLLTENLMMTIRDECLKVRQRRPDEIANAAIDIFFTSLANDFKDRAIGIILSGMGTDGAKGVQAISKNGGIIMVQDPDSTKYKSMPKEAIRIDHPLEVLSPGKLAKKLLSDIALQPEY